MKKINIIITVFCLTAFNSLAQGAFKFEKTEHNFGNIEEGVQATYTFNFKNIGDAPIVIANVKPSCGCTAPKWPKEPILPRETSSIKVVYNSKKRPGAFYKTITINSNAKEASKSLKIKGTVNPKKDGTQEK